MLKCKVFLRLPLKDCPDVSIAEYNFDPGLKVGDQVSVKDWTWQKIKDNESGLWVSGEETFSFEAMVTLRKYVIEPQNFQEANFRILIGLEMADKEQLLKLAEIIEHNSTP